MKGNPCALTEDYRGYVLERYRNLRLLDDDSIQKDIKKKQSDDQAPQIEHKATISLDLEFSIGGGFSGVAVDEEQWKNSGMETPFEELDEAQKSTRYWVELKLMDLELIKSEVKLWGRDFLVEENMGRADFGISLREELEITPALRDQFRDNLWLELWQEKPIIISEKPEGDEEAEPIEKIKILDNLPVFTKKQIGVMRIKSESWLENANPDPQDLTIHQKQFFYKQKRDPRFLCQNLLISLKHRERDLMDKYVQGKMERAEAREKEEKEKKAEGQAAKGKEKKVDKKADKAGGKGATGVEIKGDPEELGLPTEQKYTLVEREASKPFKKPTGVTREEEIQKELTHKYDIVIPLEQWMTVRACLNQPEKKEPTEPEEPADPKKKK